VEFGCSQCKEKEVEAELEDEHGLLPNVDVIVQIVGCCSESHCKVATPKDGNIVFCISLYESFVYYIMFYHMQCTRSLTIIMYNVSYSFGIACQLQ